MDILVRLAEGDPERAVGIAGTVRGSRGRDPRYLWPVLAAAMQACADAGSAGPAAGANRVAGLRDALAQVAAGTAQPGPVERAHAAVFTAEGLRAAGRADLMAWDKARLGLGPGRAAVPAGVRTVRAAGAQPSRTGTERPNACDGPRTLRPAWVLGRCWTRLRGWPGGRGSTFRLRSQAGPGQERRSA